MEVETQQTSVPLPSLGSAADVSATFNRERLERILALVIAAGTGIIGLQALISATVEPAGPALMSGIQIAIVFVPFIAMIIACVLGMAIRVTSSIVVIATAIVIASWPLFLRGTEPNVLNAPWVYLIVDIAVAASVLAFSRKLQIVVLIVLPLLYGVGRLVLGEFARSFWIQTVFDTSFAIILGGVIVTVSWLLRASADRVDDARQRAISSYSGAKAAVAAEQERVAVAALMHDSVLAALIAAERADNPRSQALAASMASEALTRLANSEASSLQHGSDSPVDVAQVAQALRQVLAELGADAVVEETGPPALVPDRVARAVALAARQALSNAMAHAHGRGMHVVVASLGDDHIEVSVMDRGEGFDADQIADDRLGIRASISARMAGIAGNATITSSDEGTRVDLEWDGR